LFSRYAPFLFDDQGRFLGEVGRIGPGPEELPSPHTMTALPGDSVLVVGAGRRAVIISPELRVVRQMSIPELTAEDLVVLDWPSKLLVLAESNTPGRVGWPLHIVERRDTRFIVAKSFGPGDGEVRPGESYKLVQVLSSPQSDYVLTAERNRYRITRWDHAGSAQTAIEYRPDWFPAESDGFMGAGPDRPAGPEIAGLVEDTNGRLWVFANVAVENWRELWKNTPRPAGVAEVRADWGPPLHALLRTRIDVLDPRTSRIMTHTFLVPPIIAVLRSDMVATYSVQGDRPVVSIVRISMTVRS
jgi:hypothetical protein